MTNSESPEIELLESIERLSALDALVENKPKLKGLVSTKVIGSTHSTLTDTELVEA